MNVQRVMVLLLSYFAVAGLPSATRNQLDAHVDGWDEVLRQVEGASTGFNHIRALRAVPSYVKSVLGENAGGHDWWHAERVARLALRLAHHEGADAELCVLTAAVHDIVDYKLVEDEEAAERSLLSWLSAQGLPRTDVDRVCRIATTLSFNGGEGPSMTCLEGRVVQDADRLDSLGAIGLARTLAFGGTIGRPIHIPGLSPRFGMSAEEYRTHVGTSINHIRERLLLVRERLNTESARELAVGRERLILDFLDHFEDEWVGRR